MPRFIAFYPPIYRDGNDPKNGPPVAAIRVQREGAVNSQWLVRDFREILGKLRPTHRQSGRPTFWPLISTKHSSFLSHFPHPDIGLRNGPENRPSLAAIRVQKEAPVNPHELVRDIREIMGKLRPTRRQSGRPPFWALIANRNASVYRILATPISGWKMTPEMGHP